MKFFKFLHNRSSSNEQLLLLLRIPWCLCHTKSVNNNSYSLFKISEVITSLHCIIGFRSKREISKCERLLENSNVIETAIVKKLKNLIILPEKRKREKNQINKWTKKAMTTRKRPNTEKSMWNTREKMKQRIIFEFRRLQWTRKGERKTWKVSQRKMATLMNIC